MSLLDCWKHLNHFLENIIHQLVWIGTFGFLVKNLDYFLRVIYTNIKQLNEIFMLKVEGMFVSLGASEPKKRPSSIKEWRNKLETLNA